MASIPLIALAGRPPEQPDTLGQYARIVGLKQAQQQMQYQQQMQPMQLQQEQLAIQQQQMQHDSEMSMMDAYSKAGGDLNQTLQLARQSGKVLPQTMIGLQKEIIGYQQSLATLDKTQLEAKHDQIEQTGRDAGALLALPQNQRVDYLTSSGIGQRWGVDPKTADPNQLNNLVDDTHLGFLQTRSDAGLKDIKDRREALTSAAELPGKQAASAEAVAKNQALQAFLTNPQNAGKTQADYEVAQAARKKEAEEAVAYPYQAKLTQLRESINNQFWNQKDVISKVEQNVVKPLGDQLQAVQQLKDAVDLAEAGNLTAARAVVPKLVGISQPLGSKRYNQAEAEQLASQGGVPQRFVGLVQNLAMGNPWTSKMSQDMRDLADTVQNTAINSANTQIDTYNSFHHTNVGHISAPAARSAATPSSGGGMAPEGTVIRMPDGSHQVKQGGKWVAQP